MDSTFSGLNLRALKIAYFINHYPKVSHSFIRREILALERQGFEIQRIALHGWNGPLPTRRIERNKRRPDMCCVKEVGRCCCPRCG